MSQRYFVPPVSDRHSRTGVLLEYQLPLTSRRLDCMITGRNGQDRENAVIVELKQWEGANAAIDDERVSTWLGGTERDVLRAPTSTIITPRVATCCIRMPSSASEQSHRSFPPMTSVLSRTS